MNATFVLSRPIPPKSVKRSGKLGEHLNILLVGQNEIPDGSSFELWPGPGPGVGLEAGQVGAADRVEHRGGAPLEPEVAVLEQERYILTLLLKTNITPGYTA